MDRLTIRSTVAELPVFDPDGDLTPTDSLDSSEMTSGFVYEGASLRSLDLNAVKLITGQVREIRSARTEFTDLRMDSVEFSACDFSSLSWTESKLSRVRFTNCKLLGAELTGLTLENVVFANCKLDYAALERIKATGPVIFFGCSLAEAEIESCDLSTTVFDGCSLHLTEFGRGTYHGCDLRGNDLSTVRGVTNLTRVAIDQGQVIQLAEALVTELQIDFPEDD
jgi:uncharacterized protein YjbI with pentapeptide repeats